MTRKNLWERFPAKRESCGYVCLVPRRLFVKKTAMRVCQVYMKYCSDDRRAKGLMEPFPTAPSRVACLPEYFMYYNYLKRLGTRQVAQYVVFIWKKNIPVTEISLMSTSEISVHGKIFLLI